MPNTFQNKPDATDTLSTSQGDLKQNFGYIQGALGKDHQIVFGDSDTGTTFEGRHTQVSLNSRGNVNLAMPGDGTDSLLWSSGGNVYWKNTTVAAGVQMTNSAVGSPLSASRGYTFLPGGLLLQWGDVVGTGSPQTVTFTTGGGITFSTCYQVLIISSNTTSIPVVTAISNTQFTFAYNNNGGFTYRWMAIGAK